LPTGKVVLLDCQYFEEARASTERRRERVQPFASYGKEKKKKKKKA
jgi:hypothetical protein